MSQAWEYLVIPRIWETAEDIADQLTLYANELNLEFVGSVQASSYPGGGDYEHYVCRRPKEAISVKFIDWPKVLTEMSTKMGKKIPEESMRRLRAKK